MTVLPKRERKFEFVWKPNWKILGFVFLFFPLLVTLGFWQLNRAEEKEQILQTYMERQRSAPMNISDVVLNTEVNFQPIKARGSFIGGRYFLLDNRVRDGRPGYEVLALFQAEGLDMPILVNRGWVAGSMDRTQLPEVSEPMGEIELTGYLFQPTGGNYSIGDEYWRNEWPELVISTDLEQLSARVGQPLYPYQVRLNMGSEAALTAGWETLSVLPEKHRGYAFQWFMMAAALVILGLFANSNLSDRFKK